VEYPKHSIKKHLDAYLDIETTGLSLYSAEIMVIGLYLTNDNQDTIVQLVGEDITKNNLVEALAGVQTIFTYNGNRYDLPFIRKMLGVDLNTIAYHNDLIYDCRKYRLFGGLKAVELQVGIYRYLQSAAGFNIMRSWELYMQEGDREALTLLLGYNKEDLISIRVLKEKLLGLTQQNLIDK
jgi:hypothetical protein